MDSLLENLAGVMNAAKDNHFGMIALAVLVFAVVVVTLLGKAPVWMRFISVLLVLIACSIPAIIVFERLGGVKPGDNGSTCKESSDCNSGECYPGPHPKLNGSGLSFCLAADLHCALPGLDGAKYDTTVFKDATLLTCANPGSGQSAQFYRK